MALISIKALTFDTGGTILDWHTGFRDALARAGTRHGVDRNWAALANELRRRSLGAMLNLGKDGPPAYNFDQAHRFTLDAILAEEGLDLFDETDRHAIAYEAPHMFKCWPDFPDVLPKLRARFVTVSFTILSYRLVIDAAKQNGLSWDAVLSCEGFGVYKLLPEAYRKAAACLQLRPEECCMVACHPFDLDAAQAVGFKTALVRRPVEWGTDPSLHNPPAVEGRYDIVVPDFPALERALPGAASPSKCVPGTGG
jgi:2-haloacid dehalogenase